MNLVRGAQLAWLTRSGPCLHPFYCILLARRGKTAAELHAGRCGICMGKIRRREETRPVTRGSGQAHLICPDWPPSNRPVVDKLSATLLTASLIYFVLFGLHLAGVL